MYCLRFSIKLKLRLTLSSFKRMQKHNKSTIKVVDQTFVHYIPFKAMQLLSLFTYNLLLHGAVTEDHE